MVHSNKFVAVVVANGQILRETRDDGSDIVRLPFGSEYSLRFKNLHTERVLVSVFVDGKDMTHGRRIVINANESADLMGEKIDTQVKNAFKFIEKTKQISEHRGDRIDDGLIRIEYQFELPITETWVPTHSPTVWLQKGPTPRRTYDPDLKGMQVNSTRTKSRGGPGMSSSMPTPDMAVFNQISDSGGVPMGQINAFSAGANVGRSMLSENGITVKGSEQEQNFTTTTVGALEIQKHAIVIQLKGITSENDIVEQAVYVNTKLQCETCGQKNPSGNRCCKNCGTYLK